MTRRTNAAVAGFTFLIDIAAGIARLEPTLATWFIVRGIAAPAARRVA